MSITKVIFLDIDGVLNYRNLFIEQRLRRRANSSYVETQLDDNKIQLLVKIVGNTGAIIVLRLTGRTRRKGNTNTKCR